MELQPAVKAEMKHIGVGCALGCAAEVAVWGVLAGLGAAAFSWQVALSAALGSLAAWGNFAGMALTVQKACSTGSEDASRQLLRLSRTWRMLALALFVIAAIKLPVFHWVAALIPLLFPRLTILGMHALGLYKPKEKGGE